MILVLNELKGECADTVTDRTLGMLALNKTGVPTKYDNKRFKKKSPQFQKNCGQFRKSVYRPFTKWRKRVLKFGGIIGTRREKKLIFKGERRTVKRVPRMTSPSTTTVISRGGCGGTGRASR